MKIKRLIKPNLMRAAMTLLVMLPWAANAQTRECNPITTYPWTENFDSYTGTTSGSTNNLPECWNYINTCTHNSYKGYPVVYGANYTSGHSGHNFLRFDSYYQYDPKPQYAILPKMSGLAGKHITLWAMGNLANNSTCTFKIGTMSDPADASTFGAFAEQELSDYSLGLGWQEYAFTVPTGTTNTYLAILMEPAPSSNQNNKWISIDDIAVFDDFSQTGDNEYTIFTAAGWGLFCDAIAGGESFNGKTVKLGADIGTTTSPITRMACDEDHKFKGTFDGQGHTLTVNYSGSEQFIAPFRVVSDTPTFRNLTVDGTINSANDYASGLIGELYGDITVEDCTSLVEISCQENKGGAAGFVGLCKNAVTFTDCVSNAVIHSAGSNNGGFVGYSWSNVNGGNHAMSFTGCVFNGKLLQINGSGTHNGGFIGWKGENQILTITNSLVDPAALAEGENYASNNSGTFARGWNNNATALNSYYTTAFGAAQGTQAHSITAGNFVTAANAGTATAYATSGITGYGTGIKYNDVLYAGSGESVGLTISNTVPASFNFTGYSVTDGASLSGSGNNYTLTMPNAEVDVVITANCTIPPISYIDENGVAQTCTYYYPLEGTETTLGTAGQETWYVAQPGTLNYSQGIQLLGNTHIILCDGAALNIGTSDSPVSGDGFYCNGVYDLSVYTQSGNTGALAIYSSQCPFVVNNLTLAGGNVNTTSYYDANCNNLTVCRSTLGISASSGSAIYALGDVTFSYVTATTNGSITCANTNFAVDHSQLTVNATNMTAIQTSGGNVTLSYVTADITSSNYQGFYCSSFAVDNSQLTVTAYYEAINALGGVITLGCTAATDFIKATRTDGYINSSYSGTVKIADGQTLYAGTNAYTGTLTDAERQAIGGQKLTNVAPPTYDYIDINGTGATHAAVVIDADNMPTSLSGWYIVQGTVNYTSTINLDGETHIILADGAVMNVTTTSNYGINGTNGNCSLFVYGQSGQSGKLNVTSNVHAIIIVQGDITIAGGIVTATSMSTRYIAIYAVVGDITITGCEVEATGGTGIFAENYSNNGGGNVTIQNATVTATTTSTGYTGAIRSYNGGITINNSNVTAMGTARYGIYAEYSGNILLNGGKITATGNNYGIYAENGNITLGWTNPTDYIYANSYSTNGTLTLTKTFIDEDGNTYESGPVNASAINGKTLYPYSENAVPYLNENGQQRYCVAYTTLTGTETELGTAGQETWYVVGSDVSYTGLTINGDIHLILADGKTMTITSSDDNGIIVSSSLTIYGQELGTGTLNATGNNGIYSDSGDITIIGGTLNATGNNGIYSVSGDITISGGTLNATGNDGKGIYSSGDITIIGGTLNATGNENGIHSYSGNITISGGRVTATSENGHGIYSYDGTTTLGWTNATDFIYVSRYYIGTSGTLNIAEGKAFIDEAGNTYSSGTVNASDINGKTLYPNCVVRKQVAGYGEGNGGWVFVASPVAGSIAPSEVHNLFPSAGETSNDYDLYRFNQNSTNGKEWQNWKQDEGQNNVAPGFSLVNGQGYLYATKETRTLVFAGEYTAATGSVEVPLDYDANAQLKGWNLVGNPFTVGATSSQPYYRMNAEGTALKTETETTAVAAMEGVFVQATGNNQTVSFTAQTRGGEKRAVAALYIQVGPSTGSGTSVLDNAIIRFDGGQTLEKFSFREGSTKLYIPQDGTDYAIVTSEGQGEMPLNFKAEENGTYTISVDVDNVNLAYLHLIDNMTGADVDLLAANGGDARHGDAINRVSTYTFEAKTTDYESRFKLVFAVGSSTGSNTFAFIDASGNIIVNGEGTLQVFDVLGHQLVTKQLSTLNYAPGVYVLRLINGENVRTQKIVVR